MKKIIIVFVLLLAGCAGQQRAIKYYTIDSYTIDQPELSERAHRTPLPYVVEVLDFSVSGPYNDTRIALRTGSNELEYFHFHQWAEMPGAAVRYFIWRVLSDADLFETCQLRVAVAAPQFIVTGAVNRLERTDIEDEAGVQVNAVFQLLDVRENRMIVSHDFNNFRPFSRNAPMNIFAQEVTNIFREELYVFIEKIDNHFASL
jgi:ABC-type uncharacterized transport system auxiliary subunit